MTSPVVAGAYRAGRLSVLRDRMPIGPQMDAIRFQALGIDKRKRSRHERAYWLGVLREARDHVN